MVSRASEAQRAGYLSRPAVRRKAAVADLRSGTQRAWFASAIIVFAIATAWSSLVLFARVYPALFPGKVLTDLLPLNTGAVLRDLPGPIRVEAPAEGSVFNKRINLLIIGVDKRPQNQAFDAYLTDSIMVATVDPLSKQSAVLSFPRDLLIDIQLPQGGTYESRVNESYGIGFRAGGSPDAGARQLAEDLKANFNIEVTHYLLLDFVGVEKLIDSIGGIDVDIPYELSVPDWWYSNDDIDARWVSFPPGPAHLNGYDAVAFGRYREDSDLFRVKRQQLVLTTALGKVFSQKILDANPFDLWDAYVATIKTDIPRAKMPGYVGLLKDTGGQLATYSLGDPVNGVETVSPFITRGGASVLTWNAENVNYILSQVFPKTLYAQSNVEVRGGYGGGDEGELSQQLGRYLRFTKALPQVFLGSDVAGQPTTSITLYNPARRQMAEDIAGWLGVDVSQVKTADKPAGRQVPDILIIVGRDFTLPDR